MRDEKEGRSKQGQTNNKAKQHSTPKAVTFPKKNELPRVGLEPTTLHSTQSALPLSYMYQGSSAGIKTCTCIDIAIQLSKIDEHYFHMNNNIIL